MGPAKHERIANVFVDFASEKHGKIDVRLICRATHSILISNFHVKWCISAVRSNPVSKDQNTICPLIQTDHDIQICIFIKLQNIILVSFPHQKW